MLPKSLIAANYISLLIKGVGWLIGFYGISTFVGYLTPNPFLCILSVLFKTIQFSMSTQFNCQKHFYFNLFSLFKQLYITIKFNVSIKHQSVVYSDQTVLFLTVQFSISHLFALSLNVKQFHLTQR